MNPKELLKKTNEKIEALEIEWDRLDSQGSGTVRQRIIARKLEGLWSTKKFLEEFIQSKH